MLATLIRDLHDVMKDARSADTITGVFDEVVEYADYHFTTEEHLMLDSGFPGYLPHKAVHDEVKRWLVRLRERFERGGRSATGVAVFEFLRDWLIDHIQVEGRKVANHLLLTARLSAIRCPSPPTIH